MFYTLAVITCAALRVQAFAPGFAQRIVKSSLSMVATEAPLETTLSLVLNFELSQYSPDHYSIRFTAC